MVQRYLGRAYRPITFAFLNTNMLGIQIQFLPHSKHSVSTTKITQLMMCLEITDVIVGNTVQSFCKINRVVCSL
jgi:hypothetical protein